MAKRFTYPKEFSFPTAAEIERELDLEEIERELDLERKLARFSWHWECTGIRVCDPPEFIHPDNSFGKRLAREGIRYFAYVKCFRDPRDNTLYGIVAGKTNVRNPDVDFSMKPEDEPRSKWNAREFLRLNGFAWERVKVLVVVPEPQETDKVADEAAKKAERWLQEQFGLWGS